MIKSNSKSSYDSDFSDRHNKEIQYRRQVKVNTVEKNDEQQKKNGDTKFFQEFTVKPRPLGFLGILQMGVAYTIMLGLSSFIPVFFGGLLYLVFSTIHILINHESWSDHSNFVYSYTIVLGILFIQGIIPLTLYKNQDLPGASNFWLLREFVNYFPMTCTVEQELPIYEEEFAPLANKTLSNSSISSNESETLEIIEEKEVVVEEEERRIEGGGSSSILKTTEKKKKNYMFALYPHAIIPVAVFMTQYYMNAILPGETVICLIHSGIFNLPFLRFWMAQSGGAPATKRHIREVKETINAHAAIVVGGVKEMFLLSQKAEKIKMRKGFIREAIRNGYDIVPVYYFGHTNIYSFFGPKRMYQWMAKHIPFPFFLYYGRNCTIFPRSTPIKMCVGRPLNVEKLLETYERNKEVHGESDRVFCEEQKEENCSVDSIFKPDHVGNENKKGIKDDIDMEEKVDYILSIFKTEISRLYYKYRPEWEERPLVMVD